MSSTAPTVSKDQIVEMLRLGRGADSVELKLTVPNASHQQTISALGIDPLRAQIRQVYFWDTPRLDLFEHGVVVRTRRVRGRGADTVVKLRPVAPDDLPANLRRLPELGIEIDVSPGGFVCSASFKGTASNGEILATALGNRPLKKAFTKQQRSFYEAHAPAELALDDLSVLGPIFVLKLRFVPSDYGRKLVGELWLYPDGSSILELSTKCVPTAALEVAADSLAYLDRVGVDVSGEQQTKTRTALEFYSKRMVATPA